MVSTRRLYFGLLGLLLVERGFELALSARNLRRARRRGAVEVGRGHFAPMVALHALFVPACAWEVVRLRRRFPGALGLVALGGALLAQGLRYWAVATLGERWNTRVVHVPGEAPVRSGPYRHVRHPNYAAVALELACVPLIHGAWASALAFSLANGVLLAVRVRVEERALGAPWQRAFAATPRFFPEVAR
jgi:methyltransferase